MSIIAEESIYVTGLNFLSIYTLKIEEKANCHAVAVITGLVEENEAKRFYQGVHENERIDIKYKVNGNIDTIFSGVLRNISLDTTNNCVLKLELISLSYLLDITKEKHTYQQIGKNISDIMRQAVDGNAVIFFNGNDKATEAMLVQYNETDWQFILRMAAFCGEPVFPNINNTYPSISIGSRRQGNSEGRTTSSGTSQSYASEKLVYAGTKIGSSIVSYTTITLEKSELKTLYGCTSKESIVPFNVNPPIYIGKVVNGIVKAVDIDKVQVHITDIDEEYDAQSNTWFPYMAAYSSSENEAGIYCMPMEGDPVRVFLPSEELKDAFVASSVTSRSIDSDPENKVFTSPYGMSVLFTKVGMRIAAGDNKVYIDLYKDGGITLKSDKNIAIVSRGNINASAPEGNIYIQAGKEISIGTDNSKLTMLMEGLNRIYMVGPQINIR